MSVIEYEVDEEFFCDPFWTLQNAKKRFVVLYGGSNSSKSWSNYQHLLLWLLEGEDNAIVYRKEGSTLRNSVYENLKSCAKQLEIFDYFDYFYSGDKREVVSKFGENKIIMSGLDDPEKMKSIVGIKRVVLEEANAFTIDDWKELVRRFRGVVGIQFVVIFNPVSETHWLKEVLFDTPAYASRAEHHLFTIDNNKFATEDDYIELEALRDIDEDQYMIYRWGKWGVIKAKNPYLLHLKRQVNGGKLEFNRFEAVYLSFDFNVKNSVLVWQMWPERNTWRVQCLREIRIGGSEEEDLEALCAVLARDYGDREIYFTGDASGNNASALSKGNKEAFRLIYDYLRGHGARFLTYQKLRANPRTRKSRFVTNAITKELGANFQIDDDCKELWSDVIRVPCDIHGNLDKVYCDKNDIGHALDCLRYFVLVFCFDIWTDIRKKIAVPKEFDMEDNRVEQDAYRNVA